MLCKHWPRHSRPCSRSSALARRKFAPLLLLLASPWFLLSCISSKRGELPFSKYEPEHCSTPPKKRYCNNSTKGYIDQLCLTGPLGSVELAMPLGGGVARLSCRRFTSSKQSRLNVIRTAYSIALPTKSTGSRTCFPTSSGRVWPYVACQ